MTKKPSSKSPRKQRRRISPQTPLHTHKKLLRCKLDELLREEYGVRSMVVRKGDLVRIMRGQFRDTEAKVTNVDYRHVRVYVDAATTAKADGKEAPVPLHPSNLMIVKMELDNERKQILQRRAATLMEDE
ncbi:MAG: 50S ribosomal protein L24 [Candidatus Thorarchaeota archaeon]|nr:50S ribosomal protein L24 [Candidatus Thorarchaeota archaeon]